MSVEQTNVIDFVGINKESGEITLAISDHLEWGSGDDHLFLLQKKINSYLSYIESGEILEKIPNASERRTVIQLHSKFEPDEEGLIFLSKAKRIIEEAGFGFEFDQH